MNDLLREKIEAWIVMLCLLGVLLLVVGFVPWWFSR